MNRSLISIVSLICVFLIACSGSGRLAPAPAAQNPSPMQEDTRRHERIAEELLDGETFSIEGVLSRPVSVFVPASVRDAAAFGLLFHFHGAAYISHTAVSRSAHPMVAVNVHLGTGSSVYERPFLDAAAFSELVAVVGDSLRAEGVMAPVPPRTFISGFSAGYGAIRAILRHHMAAIDGVLLLDGLHTDYVPDRVVLSEGGTLNTDKLEVFVEFARRAAAGDKRLLITHSEIFPGTFASTTETTQHIISRLGLERTPVLEWGPGGMQLLSRTEVGRLTILGFAGNTAPDHVDHFHGLPEFLGQLADG